jgi:hypothetical protein
VGMCEAQPIAREGSTGVIYWAARAHGRRFGVAALVLSLAACGAPAPTAAPTSAPPAPAAATPVATMRPEAATYWRQYCAAISTWNLALDHAIDWSGRARLDPSAAKVPDPEIAEAIEAMRTEIAGIAAFPPVVPVARALEKAAARMERVVGLLGPVMAEPGTASAELEQELPRLSADMASAAEFHRVAEGNYGPLDCPDGPSERVGPSAVPMSVAKPDGWQVFGQSDLKRQAQLEAIGNADYAGRILHWADFGGGSTAVVYDADRPGRSGIGAVAWMSFDPEANDLLGSMELLEEELASDATLSEVVVRYLDRPAGDAARLVAHARMEEQRDLYIVDVVRVTGGMIIVVSLMPEADAPTYWLAIEQIVGSLRVDGAVEPGAS